MKNVCAQKIGAQTLTIWARQNLQLLTSSKSGWRALVQVMLSLLHAILKWDLLPNRPAYMGGVSAVLYRLLYRHDLPKYSRPVQIFAAAYILTFFLGKTKNLTRLISVLSLQFKFVHNHKSCPNSAATLLSPQIEAILAFGRGRWKSHEFSHGGANPDNVAAGGATDARCGGEGREEGRRGTDNSP